MTFMLQLNCPLVVSQSAASYESFLSCVFFKKKEWGHIVEKGRCPNKIKKKLVPKGMAGCGQELCQGTAPVVSHKGRALAEHHCV